MIPSLSLSINKHAHSQSMSHSTIATATTTTHYHWDIFRYHHCHHGPGISRVTCLSFFNQRSSQDDTSVPGHPCSNLEHSQRQELKILPCSNLACSTKNLPTDRSQEMHKVGKNMLAMSKILLRLDALCWRWRVGDMIVGATNVHNYVIIIFARGEDIMQKNHNTTIN